MTPSTPASLLARAVTPEDLEKEIDLELILEKWQVSRLVQPWFSIPTGRT